MKTTIKQPVETWTELDATGISFGRLAARASKILIGKTTSSYISFLVPKAHVVIKNASKIRITGNKLKDKLYHHFSGYPGGIRTRTLSDIFIKNPSWIINRAVWGMLPKNKLRKRIILNLHIFKDENHPFQKKFNNEVVKVNKTKKLKNIS